MSEVRIADEATRAELLVVESRRQAALMAVDTAALDELLDEALVHIHAPGLTHDKSQLLEHVSTRQAYIAMKRGELKMRLIGNDVAIVTGKLVNRLRSPDGGERVVSGMVTQVLRRCDDGAWRYVSFQMTPDGEHVWPAMASELENQEDTTANIGNGKS